MTMESCPDVVVANFYSNPVGQINPEKHKELDYFTVSLREKSSRR
jgi:hypothetical protein